MSTEEQDSFYSNHYSLMMNTGVIYRFWGLIHHLMERPFKNISEGRVLEIGAGNGEHIRAISGNIASYYATDIRVDSLKKNLSDFDNVIVETQDVMNLSYDDNFFDRVIVTCVLVHLDNPVIALEEINRVVKPGGYISIYLPCEPGMVLRFIRKFSTQAKASRIGVTDIKYLHFLEHKTYFLAVDYYLKRIFGAGKISSRYFPFPFLSWNFNLFKLYTIRKIIPE